MNTTAADGSHHHVSRASIRIGKRCITYVDTSDAWKQLFKSIDVPMDSIHDAVKPKRMCESILHWTMIAKWVQKALKKGEQNHDGLTVFYFTSSKIIKFPLKKNSWIEIKLFWCNERKLVFGNYPELQLICLILREPLTVYPLCVKTMNCNFSDDNYLPYFISIDRQ